MVPFWIPIIIQHRIFRVPKKRDHNFDNHPYHPGLKPEHLLGCQGFNVFSVRGLGVEGLRELLHLQA